MEWKLIEQTQELTDVIDLIKASSEVAVDLEADSLHHYHSKICLLQITAQGQHFLIDTLKIGDLSEVLSALQAKTILAHGCDYDLRMMKQHWNFVPSKIFDTMIASRLIGAKAFGLANLAKEYLNLELDKGSQKADWSRRPLPDNMQHYAAMDTAILHELVSKIRHELDALGRMEWAEESCDWLLESATQAAPKERDRDSWRVKGSSNLIPKELAVLKCIWHFREELAQEWDQPVFKVLSNEKLIQMAEKATFFNEYNYQQLPKLPRNFKGSLTAKLLKGINEILSGPRETDPPRLKRKPPPVQSPHPLVLEKLREIRDSAAETLSL
jgi:ribonuclease D